MSAILQSRVIELTIAPPTPSIRPRGAAADTLARCRAGGGRGHPDRTDPTSSPSRRSASPIGLSNASFRLSRGAATRTVVVSRLGRVRIMP